MEHKAKFLHRGTVTPAPGLEVNRASRTQLAADIAQNERELEQERKARARLVARLGEKRVAELERTSRRIEQERADERALQRARARGDEKQARVIELAMAARRNGVKI